MSKKNTRNALDPSLSYAVIGLDLAKAGRRGCQCINDIYQSKVGLDKSAEKRFCRIWRLQTQMGYFW